MIDPITKIPSLNPLIKWIAAFESAYAFTDDSISELSTGLLRKQSGDGLQVRKITRDMLKNQKLAEEIYSMAQNGLLGFTSKSGSIEFRKDVAEKIGPLRTFKVVNHENPDQGEILEARITGLDKEAYHSVAGLATDLKAEEKETSEAGKKERKLASRPETGLSAVLKSNQKILQQEQTMIRQLFNRVIQQLRENEKARQEKAKERRQAESKQEHEEIKLETLKKEIRNKEITTKEIDRTDQIAKRNDGKKNIKS